MNMGKWDRIIRAVIGVIAIITAFLVGVGSLQIVLGVIGGLLLLTATIGICVLYYPFHFSTKS